MIYNNKFLQSATVICASLETDIIPKPITKFTGLAVFYVKRTMRTVIYYHNKFNVYKNKIIVSFLSFIFVSKIEYKFYLSYFMCGLIFFIGKLSNLYIYIYTYSIVITFVIITYCISQEKNWKSEFFILSSLALLILLNLFLKVKLFFHIIHKFYWNLIV